LKFSYNKTKEDDKPNKDINFNENNKDEIEIKDE